ncbi:MAG: N-acetylmuramoyl-L-alanine amidase [Flavobacteriales bacterium]|nr:N-acetylmuramoyl-L-alanine amidase [Flavobacteriales bacterium]
MGIEREVSGMEQDERLAAGPQSTQQPTGESEQRRRERLIRAWAVQARRKRWKVDQNAVGAEILWNLMRYTIGLALWLVVGMAIAQTPGRDPNRIRTVVLDAGHGGKDPGNLGTGRYKTTEKHISLNVAKLLGKYISETYPDVKVVYTRDDDTFIELRERCNIANRNKADVFISIHCNANDNRSPHGCETYVMGLHKTAENMRVAQKENEAILLEEGHELKYDGYDPKDPESIIALSLRQNTHLDHSLLLSALIQKQFKDRVGRVDRGVKQAGFLVISYNTMPSVLIELGFLTNPTEEDYLQQAEGQDYMASAIYRAFKEYKAIVEHAGEGGSRTTSSTPTDPPKAEPQAPEPIRPVVHQEATAVLFKVQIVTSSKRIPTKPQNFNGLEGVEEHKGAGMYKYTFGAEATVAAARRLQDTCRAKGYNESFIVAFKDGERIALQEALKLAEAH